MSAFEFTALDAQGHKQRGILEGDTPKQIRQALRERQWSPLTVTEAVQKSPSSGKLSLSQRQRIGTADLVLVTRQLATLVNAALPIDEALQALSKQTAKAKVRKILVAVRSQVLEGQSLAHALSQFPQAFSETYRTTIEAGESSGKLGTVLERLADYEESRQALQQKMVQALIYPAILTTIALGVISLLMLYVVPDIVQVFDHLDQELPLLTQMLIKTSEFLQQYISFMLIVGGISLLLISAFFKRPTPKFFLHRFLLKLPILGQLTKTANTARFSRTFHILLNSGIPALEALLISARIIKNLPMRKSVEAAAKRVKEGSSLNHALDEGGYFPPMMIHLIASGESSGRLEEMLERAAKNQENELENYLSTLMALLEPVMILAMGGIVLTIVLSILLPIMDMNQLVQ